MVHKTLSEICNPEVQDDSEENEEEEEEPEKKLIFLQYIGKVTDNFERTSKRINVPCEIMTTITKIKIVLTSLKGNHFKVCGAIQWMMLKQTNRFII